MPDESANAEAAAPAEGVELAPPIELSKPIRVSGKDVREIKMKNRPGNGEQRIRLGEPYDRIETRSETLMRLNSAVVANYIAESFDLPMTAVHQLESRNFTEAGRQVLSFF